MNEGMHASSGVRFGIVEWVQTDGKKHDHVAAAAQMIYSHKSLIP